MKQTYTQTDPRREGTEHDPCRQLYESCRQWLESAGDVDDFIFYQSESFISER